MADRIDGFAWDAGNEAKCERHSLTRPAIEAFFRAGPLVAPDAAHSVAEQRFIAVGRIPAGEEGAGRAAFVAFTIRQVVGARLIRPISARFMHAKEVRRYEDFEAEEGSGPAGR